LYWLAVTLGRTVNELLDTMTSDEYTHWIAYRQLMDNDGNVTSNSKRNKDKPRPKHTATTKQDLNAMKANLMKYAAAKGVKDARITR
jgi:hypothetical protein